MKRVIICGGNGFVGKAVQKELKKYNYYIVCRNPKKKQEIKGDITNKKSLQKIIQKNDIIINLVGLTPLKKPKGTTYHKVHVQGVKNLVEICSKKKCTLIHMSALGASKTAPTKYLQTKGEAEDLIINSKIKYTIICPSIIYDTDSEIIKMFNTLSKLRIFPNIPAVMQPVYRRDIAKIFTLAVQENIKEQKIEMGGPEKLSLYKMAKQYYNTQNKVCIKIPLWCVKIGITLGIIFHIGRVTKDNITNLALDNTTNTKQQYITLKKYTEWIKENKFQP